MPADQPSPLSLAAFREAPLALAVCVIGLVIFLASLVAFSFFGLQLHRAATGALSGSAVMTLGAMLYRRHEQRGAE